MKKFIIGRLKSMKYALKGVYIMMTTEASIIAQCSIFVGVIILGFVVGITRQEWMIQTLAMTIILCVEGLNTAIEGVADFIHPEHHPKIGYIKDVAAGAVTFAAIGAFVVFCVLYYPYFF